MTGVRDAAQTGTVSGGTDMGTALRKRPKPAETAIQAVLAVCAGVSILTTAGIIVTLVSQSIPFFREVDLVTFFTGTVWQPQIDKFGILPLLNATAMTSLIAMLIALPAGMAVAIYLSEYATSEFKNTLKPILEVLAGIPTVVYGYFALQTITPFLRSIFGSETIEIYNMASAGIAMGILILPLVSTMCEDALSAVPRSMREAAYAVGATKFEVSVKIVVPAALSGIGAAFILALSRAFGETMIVAVASGSGPRLTVNPFLAAETMTGHIVRISGGDLSYDSIDYNSLFAIGLLLFAVTFCMNLVSRRIIRKYREVYE